MAQVVDTWSGSLDAGDPADGAVVDTALDALRAGVNSIDGTQIAASAGIPVAAFDTGTLLHNAGVATKYRIQAGRKAITMTAVESVAATITYSTESNAIGPVAFGSGVPIVLLTVQDSEDSPCVEVGARIMSNPTTTTCAIELFSTTGGAVTKSITLHWLAIGLVT